VDDLLAGVAVQPFGGRVPPTGQPVDNFETICTRKDRTTFPVKLTIAPIRDADGAVVGASAIARDVTEQK
jgi:PAS domain S-box-containing protein